MKLPRLSRRVLVRLRNRLDASPLRITDPVWLDLDSELTAMMVQQARERVLEEEEQWVN